MASFDANSRIPAPGGQVTPGLFFPPDFPFMGSHFDPSQPQFTPFPPVPMPPFGFPALMAPSGSSNLPTAPPNLYAAAETNQLSASQLQPRGDSHKTDSNREEGEVSECESAPDSTKKDARDPKQAGPERRPAARQLELNQGENVFSPSRSSSRSSGSRTGAFDVSFVHHSANIQQLTTHRSRSQRIRTSSIARSRLRNAIRRYPPQRILNALNQRHNCESKRKELYSVSLPTTFATMS